MDIIIEGNHTHYELGQTVSGVVRLTTDEQVKNVKLELHGCVHVEWTEIPNLPMYDDLDIAPPVTYHDHKPFLELVQKVSEEGMY